MKGLRFWRRARGLTQRDLAASSGVQQRTISRIESGLVEEPRTATLLKLAGALGVDPIDLIFGELSVGVFGAPEGLVRGGYRKAPVGPPEKAHSSSPAGAQERPENITTRDLERNR